MSIENQVKQVQSIQQLQESVNSNALQNKWANRSITAISVLATFFIAIGLNVTGIFESFTKAQFDTQQSRLQAEVALETERINGNLGLERSALDGLIATNESFNLQILGLTESLDKVVKANTQLTLQNQNLQEQISALKQSVAELEAEIVRLNMLLDAEKLVPNSTN